MPASRCGTAWIAATDTALSMNASATPRTARRHAVSAKPVSACMPVRRNIDSAAIASPIVSTMIGATRPMSRPTNGLTTAVVPLRKSSRTAIASGARCCVPPRKMLSRNIPPTSAKSPIERREPGGAELRRPEEPEVQDRRRGARLDDDEAHERDRPDPEAGDRLDGPPPRLSALDDAVDARGDRDRRGDLPGPVEMAPLGRPRFRQAQRGEDARAQREDRRRREDPAPRQALEDQAGGQRAERQAEDEPGRPHRDERALGRAGRGPRAR